MSDASRLTFGGTPMSVDDALLRMLAAVHPLPAEQVALHAAVGRVSAQDISAPFDLPPFTNSAMDGFAIASSSAVPGGRTTLQVIGAITAGDATTALVRPGQAVRIMTGAPLPPGTDAVVRLEETDVHRDDSGALHVSFDRHVPAGLNVRSAGESISRGETIVRAGTAVGAPEVADLAAFGLTHVRVHRQPKVVILSTGNELVAPGTQRQTWQVFDTNTALLQVLIQQAGGVAEAVGIARDTPEEILSRLMHDPVPDLIITTGGVSVGDFDVVKDVLIREGTLEIWRVRMKPGRPVAFGRLRAAPVLGLPGNPHAAHITFLQFGRPLIRRLLGFANPRLPVMTAVVNEAIENAGGRRLFVPGNLSLHEQPARVTPLGQRSQRNRRQRMNCLIDVPEDVAFVEEGSAVVVQVLDEVMYPCG